MSDDTKIAIIIASVIAAMVIFIGGSLVAQSMYSDYLISKSISNGADPIKVKCAFGSERVLYNEPCKNLIK